MARSKKTLTSFMVSLRYFNMCLFCYLGPIKKHSNNEKLSTIWKDKCLHDKPHFFWIKYLSQGISLRSIPIASSMHDDLGKLPLFLIHSLPVKMVFIKLPISCHFYHLNILKFIFDCLINPSTTNWDWNLVNFTWVSIERNI